MRRREQREHVFKLMFMTEFNSEEEMTEQLSLYFEGLGELSEQDQEYMKKKYAHVKEHLEEIVRCAEKFFEIYGRYFTEPCGSRGTSSGSI